MLSARSTVDGGSGIKGENSSSNRSLGVLVIGRNQTLCSRTQWLHWRLVAQLSQRKCCGVQRHKVTSKTVVACLPPPGAYPKPCPVGPRSTSTRLTRERDNVHCGCHTQRLVFNYPRGMWATGWPSARAREREREQDGGGADGRHKPYHVVILGLQMRE